jgi:AcrR family transcriptional regulator
MSPRRANPELADRRRDALVRAGYAEILEKGIPGTTLDAVVARAGSSKGGALYYFPSKEDLLCGVLEWLLHSTELNRKLYLVLFDFVPLGARVERYKSIFARFFEACQRRDAEIVELGIREQRFRRVNPRDGAATIRALVDGYCLQWLMGPAEVPIENYRDLCRGVLGAYLLR